MTQFPNRDFGPKWLKSFLFTSRMRKEREKMDVNRYLTKYSQKKICYFYYNNRNNWQTNYATYLCFAVAIIANLVSRIFLQISIDVHFFSFSFHSTSKKETFEPYKSKIAIGELCHNEDRNMG